MQPNTERMHSRKDRCYFPHTETASTNARPLLVGGADLHPAQLFSHYFAEHTDLDPGDFRVAQLDVSNRDLLAPTTQEAQRIARDASGRLPLVGVRMGGGRRGAFGKRVDQRPNADGRYFMYTTVREVVLRRETDDPLPQCLQAHAAGAGGGAGAGAGAGAGGGAGAGAGAGGGAGAGAGAGGGGGAGAAAEVGRGRGLGQLGSPRRRRRGSVFGAGSDDDSFESLHGFVFGSSSGGGAGAGGGGGASADAIVFAPPAGGYAQDVNADLELLCASSSNYERVPDSALLQYQSGLDSDSDGFGGVFP